MSTTPIPDFLTFRDELTRNLQKPTMVGEFGTKWQTVMGDMLDAEYDKLFVAKYVQWPEYTPSDALYYLATERMLERVRIIGTGAEEAEATHRAHLKDAWAIWHRAGTQEAHRETLGWPGFNSVSVIRRQEASTPPPVGTPYVRAFAKLVWSQFDIIFRKPMPVSALLWGGFFWGGGATYGTSLTLPEVQLMRRLVRDHKAAHDTCTYFHFHFGTGSLWGTFTWGSGVLYGGAGDTVTGVCGEKRWETLGYM